MKEDKEIKLKTIVGKEDAKHTITKDRYALTLARRGDKKRGHAFLILEGVKNGERYIKKIDLGVVPSKNRGDPTKGIIYTKKFPDWKLEEIVDGGLNSYTWGISPKQAKAFEALVMAEKERGRNGDIEYTLFGKTKFGGSVGGSSQRLGSAQLREKAQECIDNLRRDDNVASVYSGESLIFLIASGHNCYSWATAMVKAIGLEVGKEIPFFACIPKMDIRGVHNCDEESYSRCVVM